MTPLPSCLGRWWAPRVGPIPRGGLVVGVREVGGSEVAPVAPSALSCCLAASLHGAHVQLRGVGRRHPPRHQQPRHRLLGPAGGSPPQPRPWPLPHESQLWAGTGTWLASAICSRSLSPPSARNLPGAGAARCRRGGDAGELWPSRATPSHLSRLPSCLSSASPRSSTRPGAAQCRAAGCTRPGWRGTRPSPTSPSTPRTPRTSCSTTPTCSASSTSPW